MKTISGWQTATTPSGSFAFARSNTHRTRSAASPTLVVVVPPEPGQSQTDDEAQHRGEEQSEDQRDVGCREEELHVDLLRVLEDEDAGDDDDRNPDVEPGAAPVEGTPLQLVVHGATLARVLARPGRAFATPAGPPSQMRA